MANELTPSTLPPPASPLATPSRVTTLRRRRRTAVSTKRAKQDKRDKKDKKRKQDESDEPVELSGKEYARALKKLHVELVRLQEWVKHAGVKVCAVQ